ncbi:FYN-binding protein 1-like [Lethenteron reissneri]|uniref:FYN-binding protein 1-like n=1 Tax=Lethenteron reissneri TaxID=7753 RepID=UPI002AB69ED6|nr:FYN-binding protein 1-like [Lethenteron reissneri]
MRVAWEVKIMAAPDIKKLMACFNNEEAGGGATSVPQPPLSAGPKLSGSSPFFPGRGGASARGGGVGVGFTGRGGARFGGVGGASSEVGGATDGGGGSEVVSGAKFGRGGAKFGVGGASEAVGGAKMWGMGGAKPEVGGAKSGVGETPYEVSGPSDGAGGMGRGVAKFGGVSVAKVWGVGGAKFGVGVPMDVAGRAKPGGSGASNEADGGASFGGRGGAKFEGVGGAKIVTGGATDGVGGAKEGDNAASACSSGDGVGGGVKFGGGGAKFGGNRVGVASDDTGGARPAVGGASVGVGVGRFGSAVSGATSGVGGTTLGGGGTTLGGGGAPPAVSPLAAKLRAQIASVKSGGRTGGKEEEGGEKRWKRGGAGTSGGTLTQEANGGPAGFLRGPAPPRKVLPKPLLLGQAPKKPARPPSVELSRFRAQVATRGAMGATPPSLPATMTLITKATVPTAQLVEENYDDVELPGPPTWMMGPALPGRGTAPPLPTPRPEVPASSTRGKAPAAEVEEQQQDVYEDFYEDLEEKSEETVRERTEREKKEAKERERRDTEMKKKYKVGIDTPALHVAVASRGSAPSGRLDLGVRQGERLAVLLLTGTPEGTWVVRNETGSVGLVETYLLDLEMDSSQDIYDDVAEETKANASGDQFPSADDDETESGSSGGKGKTWNIFKGINLRRDKKRSVKKQDEEDQDVPPEDDEVYDDVESQDLRLSVRKEDKKAEEKMRKIREREEREARKKFKLSGDLPTLSVVSLLRDLRPLGRLDLSGSKGDTFDLVQNTDEMRALCRNRLGKYGYIPREHLSQPDQEDSDIYDNLDEDP